MKTSAPPPAAPHVLHDLAGREHGRRDVERHRLLVFGHIKPFDRRGPGSARMRPHHIDATKRRRSLADALSHAVDGRKIADDRNDLAALGIRIAGYGLQRRGIDIDGRDGRALACEQFDARAPHAGGRRRDHRQFVF